MRYYLIKRGLYYRQLSSGYTDKLIHAGTYSEKDAKARVENVEGVTMISVAEAEDNIRDEIDEYKQKLICLEGTLSTLSDSEAKNENN